MLELLKSATLYAVGGAFLLGLLVTVVTGSATAVKRLLAGLGVLVILGLVAALVLTRGLAIYLLFQVIGAVLILFLILIAGAVCGGGLYLLLHRKPRGQPLDAATLHEHVPLAEFCTRESLDEERVLSRLRSGYYRGGLHGGAWYVHGGELSRGKPPAA